MEGSLWPWRLSLKSSSVTGHKTPSEMGMHRAAGVFISYSLNPAVLCHFLLHALIELRIICSVLVKCSVLVQTGIILLFWVFSCRWVGRHRVSLFAYLAGLLWVIFIDWKLGKTKIFFSVTRHYPQFLLTRLHGNQVEPTSLASWIMNIF